MGRAASRNPAWPLLAKSHLAWAEPAFTLEEKHLSLMSTEALFLYLVVHLQGPIFPEKVPLLNSHKGARWTCAIPDNKSECLKSRIVGNTVFLFIPVPLYDFILIIKCVA